MDENNRSGENRAPQAAICGAACVLIFLIPTVLQFSPLSFLKIFAIPLFACIFSVLLEKSGSSYALLCAGAGVLSLFVRYFTSGGFTVYFAASSADLLFALILGISLRILCEKKAPKSLTFAFSSLIAAIYAFSLICIAVYSVYGSFSLSAIGDAVRDVAGNVADAYYAILSSAASQTPYADQLSQTISYISQSIEYTIRLNFPTLTAYFAMLYGGVTVLIYRPILKITKTDETLLSGRTWVFRLSGVSVAMFYLSYAAYIIVLLFVNNSVISGVLLNLTQIITVPFAVRGAVFLYEKLRGKLGVKAASILIVAASSLIASFILGTDAVLIILACAGAYSESRRALRQE